MLATKLQDKENEDNDEEDDNDDLFRPVKRTGRRLDRQRNSAAL
jgi:hypothetical protein